MYQHYQWYIPGYRILHYNTHIGINASTIRMGNLHACKQLASTEEARSVLYPISGFHWLLLAATGATANATAARHTRLRGRLHIA